MGIADRIKRIRGDESQEYFSSKLGVHKNTLGRWERGERIPDQENLCKILEVFPEINPAWLLTGEGPMRWQKDPHANMRQLPVGVDIDLDRLTLAIETIDEALQATGRTMRSEKKAEMVTAVYDFFGDSDQEKAKERVLRLIKTAI